MKIYMIFALLYCALPLSAMMRRMVPSYDHVIIDIPLQECGICFEDKTFTGFLPCEQGEKHPNVCDDCMHKLYEDEHACKGQCPFCKRTLANDLACSICKEKFKQQKKDQVGYGCLVCFIYLYRKIRLFRG